MTKCYVLSIPCMRETWCSNNVSYWGLKIGLGMKLFSAFELSILYHALHLISPFSLIEPLRLKKNRYWIYLLFCLCPCCLVVLPWSPYVVFPLLWKEMWILLNNLKKQIGWNMVVMTSHRWNYLYCSGSIPLTFTSTWFSWKYFYCS